MKQKNCCEDELFMNKILERRTKGLESHLSVDCPQRVESKCSRVSEKKAREDAKLATASAAAKAEKEKVDAANAKLFTESQGI